MKEVYTKLKRSRYYLFGNETLAWYKTKCGKWRSENYGYMEDEGPWGLSDDLRIIKRAKANGMSIQCFTKKEYENYMFLQQL